MQPVPDIWRLERRIGNQLFAWGGSSVVLGLPLALLGGPFLRGFGVQFLIWGAIDTAIAIGGRVDLRRARRRTGADAPEVRAARRRRLTRLLRINAGLDLLYVGAGVLVLLLVDGPTATGHGVGVIVQGGFLLGFDAWHARTSAARAA